MSESRSPRRKTIGDPAILDRPLLGFFCSRRCPGDIILRTYDLARELRDAGVPVIGGFHTAMERQCLALLLRGRQPVVVCPARGIEGMRLRTEWKEPIEQGRLLVVSPFDKTGRRQTAELAERRNQFVAELARAAFIAHASPGGATSALFQTLVERRIPTWTFASDTDSTLVNGGAKPLTTVNEIRIALMSPMDCVAG